LVGIKGMDGASVWDQRLRSLPAAHLYGTTAERRCWQRCSREVRNSEEKRDETEQDGSGQGPCPVLSLPGATSLAVGEESQLWDTMQPQGTCLPLLLPLTSRSTSAYCSC